MSKYNYYDCPALIPSREGIDMCELNDKFCLREEGLVCDYYNEWVEECENEEEEERDS